MKTEANLPLKDRRLLVAASGSIAAVKTPLLVSNLIKAGAEVRCIVTPSASRLVSPVSLATLSRNRCYQDDDQWDSNEPRPLHISLAEWAELVIVAPLSATTLSRWTQGLGEGLLASTLLACEKPVIAAAAMNTGMWSSPAVTRNWQLLQADPRVLCLSPEEGLLACDRVGEGRMANPELLVLAARSALLQADEMGNLKRDWAGINLLATAGPTQESIDLARVITNQSSGRMGVLLAQAARFRGAQVDLIHGPLQIPEALLEGLRTHPVKTAEEMQMVLAALQPTASAIAMASAVGDLRCQKTNEFQKHPKEKLIKLLGEQLEEVPDLLAELVANKPNDQSLLGFSALTGSDSQIKQLGEAKRIQKGCDLLFANPIDRPGQGFVANTNGGWLLTSEGNVYSHPVISKLELAHLLLDALLKDQTKKKAK